MLNFLKNIFKSDPEPDYVALLKEGALVLDVRTGGEYAGGNIKNSLNISVDYLPANLKRLKDKNQPIITCCASGMRSSSAKRILKAAGYTNVHNGGSWIELKGKLGK
jgi:rhodanese-related sulfurtransferase